MVLASYLNRLFIWSIESTSAFFATLTMAVDSVLKTLRYFCCDFWTIWILISATKSVALTSVWFSMVRIFEAEKFQQMAISMLVTIMGVSQLISRPVEKLRLHQLKDA